MKLETTTRTYVPLEDTVRLSDPKKLLKNGDEFRFELNNFTFPWGGKLYSKFMVNTSQTVYFEDECTYTYSRSEVPSSIMAYNQIYEDYATEFEVNDTSFSSISYQLDSSGSIKILKIQFQKMNTLIAFESDSWFNTQIWLYENGMVDVIIGEYYAPGSEEWEFEAGFAPVVYAGFVDECHNPESDYNFHYLHGDAENPKVSSFSLENFDTTDVLTKTFLTNLAPPNLVYRFKQVATPITETSSVITKYITNSFISEQLEIRGQSAESLKFIVTDINGRVIFRSTIMQVNKTINCSHWSTGLYLIHFDNGHSEKIIKTH